MMLKMRISKILSTPSMKIPKHLRIAGRSIDPSFTDTCLLYRGFSEEDIDEILGSIKTEHIRFPDYSCNWNRYSSSKDIRHRKKGSTREGCYSIQVQDAKYENLARPVHDPVSDGNYENYAHVDVRMLLPSDSEGFIPPPNRRKPKSAWFKSLKLEYRMNIVNNLKIELNPAI